MNEKKHEGTFIPCGDSLERMQEIREDDLEQVSGGSGLDAADESGIMSGTMLR